MHVTCVLPSPLPLLLLQRHGKAQMRSSSGSSSRHSGGSSGSSSSRSRSDVRHFLSHMLAHTWSTTCVHEFKILCTTYHGLDNEMTNMYTCINRQYVQ